MTDDEKHADCIKRTGFCAVFLPPRLYDAGERAGLDMSGYVKTKPIPIPSSTPNMEAIGWAETAKPSKLG